ncbi:MAG: SDR family NAD(P)-dependent oxidoreductase [Synechococcus sp.]
MSNRTETQPSSQRILLALDEAIAKLEAVERAKTEPIAIIGTSCRFPGGANNPEEFWQVLSQGVDTIGEVPPERWDIDQFYDPDPEAAGKTYTRYGGFLQQVDQFDPQFFGISPREAANMDPQQRLLLEVSWEALERAGLIPKQLSGSQTGVFVGITTNDYARLLVPGGDLNAIDTYFLAGNPLNAVAGRLSYTFGLQGPSIAIDTACSSSLVSVHLASQSLRNGECDLALAGGVNLILAPDNTVALSRARMMAPDGRCKTFDATANGFVRGEGCGMLVLKRLSDAERDGDRILALIRSSAVNQDGPSSGFTVPNKAAQEALMQRVLTAANITPADVDYVEAHGTGTSLGDPIEIRALAAVLGHNRPGDRPIAVGSVKTNIGHLESAAGVAGLIKVILSLQHQQIPPHLHLKQPNPYINWDELPVTIPTRLTPWPQGYKPRLAGVSSFGASGTNAHILLEEAPSRPSPSTESSKTGSGETSDRPLHLLTLSAKSEKALLDLARRYKRHLAAHPEQSLADLCCSANTGRSHFAYRLAAIASSPQQLRDKLATYSPGQSSADMTTGHFPRASHPRVVFLFTGQGSQYVDMGRQLYETQPTFRAALDRCADILAPYLEQPLLSVLYPPAGRRSPLNDTAYTQPALFALEYALAQLWLSWGVRPSAVMGHSVGEYVAACLAGVFSLEEGLQLLATRARLMQQLPRDGAMVSLLADAQLVRDAIKPYAGDVAIAAINGPNSTVISGRKSIVDRVCSTLKQQGIKVKPLRVSHAFHSPLMEPMLAEFEAVARTIAYSPPQIELISNVTGQTATGAIASADYWCRHISQPVLFASSVQTLARQGYDAWLEVGPKPTLLGMGRLCVPDRHDNAHWLPSLRPGREDWHRLLQSLATLYASGADIDWSGFDRDYHRQAVLLPTYPFQRQRFWVRPHSTSQVRQPTEPPVVKATNRYGSTRSHPLLGQRLQSALQHIQYESRLALDTQSWLAHHQICQAVVVPATAYVEMAIAAGTSALRSQHLSVSDIAIKQALVLSGDTPATVQLILSPKTDAAYSFQIFSAKTLDAVEESDWTLHATGEIQAAPARTATETSDIAPLQQAERGTPIAVDAHYQRFRERGMDYGPSFQGLQNLWQQADGTALGQMRLAEDLTAEVGQYHLHPALLDACFQILGAIAPDNGRRDTYMPVGIESLTLYRRPGAQVWSRAKIRDIKGAKQQLLVADVQLLDETGILVADVSGLSLRSVSRKVIQRMLQTEVDTGSWLYRTSWNPQPLVTSASTHNGHRPSRQWLLFCDAGDVGTTVAQQLRERGDRPVTVTVGESFCQLDESTYVVNPARPQDFQQLLSAVASNDPLHGVVHLWSLDCQESTSSESLQASQLHSCGSVLHLVQALAARSSSAMPRLWLITRGAQAIDAERPPIAVEQAPLWGLGGAIALEHPDFKCVRVDLDPSGDRDTSLMLINDLLSPDREDRIAYRQGDRHVARLVRYSPQSAQKESLPTEPFQIKISEYGILENLTLAPMQRRSPQPGEVEIEVRATGLNFRDVLNALGMLREYSEQLGIESSTDMPFGGECAGTIVAVGEGVTAFAVGDEVVAAQAIGSLSSYVTVPADFVAYKPQNLSFEAAATIPIAFLTAYHGLCQWAQVKAGDRVLIHSAAGGVGQAAVQLAQQAGAEVWGTASQGKWAFLQSTGVKRVMNSRTLEFADEVMAATQGQGVDVVLNSLNGEFIPKSLQVLAPEGRFVEIGKLGIWGDRQVSDLRPDVGYHPFDLLDISTDTPPAIRAMLDELMPEFDSGHLVPLPHKVFPVSEVVNAFRYMAQAKHIGKVVISIPVPTSARQPHQPVVRPDCTYWITGGLGALGLEVARWLVAKGAQHLVLTSRRGVVGDARNAVNELEASGATVAIAKADVALSDDVARVLERIQTSMPPLRGLIHAAGVLDDGVLMQQQWERFEAVMAPKVAGAWNLHAATQSLSLDWFVCFSSASALLGSPGQGNYAAANAFMDALAHHRRHVGLPGLSVNWGPWAQSGMAAELQQRDRKRLAAQGAEPIPPDRGLTVMGELLEQGATQVGVLPINWSTFRTQLPPGTDWPFLEDVAPSTQQSATTQPVFLDQLAAAPPGDRQALLIQFVRSQIARVLGASSPEEIDLRQGFADLGMDSLTSVELRNRLQTSLDCTIPSTAAFDYPNAEALANYLARDVLMLDIPTEQSPLLGTDRGAIVPMTSPTAPSPESDAPSDGLDDLSQSELADLLARELTAIEDSNS